VYALPKDFGSKESGVIGIYALACEKLSPIALPICSDVCVSYNEIKANYFVDSTIDLREMALFSYR